MKEEEAPAEEPVYVSNGATSAREPDRIEPPMDSTQEAVSKVGNVKVGLDLLKKGRLALDEVRPH